MLRFSEVGNNPELIQSKTELTKNRIGFCPDCGFGALRSLSCALSCGLAEYQGRIIYVILATLCL